MAMTAQEVRRAFLEFYGAKDHSFVQSAPLVPLDDPTLLFTSAGMVQFKKYYSGAVALPYRRAVSIQKCLRVTDIEDVGRTPRHNTFFEMLGHFSFGDYFKKEAIVWNWELFTRIFGIDPERLTASVYVDDDEAHGIWRREVGLPEERIVRLGAKDNFWGPAGGTGACGPCSELYFDLGPQMDPEHPGARAGDETDRFIEVGNFVFPQFDRQADGRDLPLKNRGIDTGIGLERLTMVVQGKTSIFQTDLFRPIIDEAARLSGRPYAGNEIALHIIADHIRALVFALSEGVVPGNEGRAYVIRRLIRRAAVQGYNLGLREPFLFRLVDAVVSIMGETYPEVGEGRARAVLTLRNEEQRFGDTLEAALTKLGELLKGAARTGKGTVSGEEAFLLYDTYGLPFELIVEMAGGRGLAVDREGFECCLERQKERSRSASSFSAVDDALGWHEVRPGPDSDFVGDETERAAAHVMRYALLAGEPARALVVLDRTPFYGAAGGQIGDTGVLADDTLSLAVRDTLHEGRELRHLVDLPAGARERLADPETVWEAAIDAARRESIRRHHTATHLLQAALRKTLGTHVTQAGSLVAAERLRFDFTHFSALNAQERAQVEELVNQEIVRDHEVLIRYSTYEEAVREGVMALFGEKYEAARVRRVRVPGVSEELCGGMHVRRTGQIGAFLILEETAVASGTRRIEAACGLAAIEQAQRLRAGIAHLRRLLGTGLDELPAKVEGLLAEVGQLKKDLAKARRGEGGVDLERLIREAEPAGDARFVVGEVSADSVGALRELGDRMRRGLGSGAALLLARIDGKAMLLAIASEDLVDRGRLRADEVIREISALAGGSGGGKPHMALGGARDEARIPAALEAAREMFRARLTTP
ncbi:MAG: alanine--tRNA ligase [Candidatus Eisenbacteria bacterium]